MTKFLILYLVTSLLGWVWVIMGISTLRRCRETREQERSRTTAKVLGMIPEKKQRWNSHRHRHETRTVWHPVVEFRGTSDSYYDVTLKVAYTNRQGTPESTTVQFGSTNPNAIPDVGDQFSISRGLSGMVTHPNRNLIGIGGGAAGIGGLFLLLYFLTMLRWRKKQ